MLSLLSYTVHCTTWNNTGQTHCSCLWTTALRLIPTQQTVLQDVWPGYATLHLWYGSSSVVDRKGSAENYKNCTKHHKPTATCPEWHLHLPLLEKTHSILQDWSHPIYQLFELLPSGQRFCPEGNRVPKCNNEALSNIFLKSASLLHFGTLFICYISVCWTVRQPWGKSWPWILCCVCLLPWVSYQWAGRAKMAEQGGQGLSWHALSFWDSARCNHVI